MTCLLSRTGTQWFVSRSAAGTNNGTSWTNAWTDFNQIAWASIKPGDCIDVDGGSTSLTYTGVLAPTTSGTASNPITIRLSQDSGRNGQAILQGGRTLALPYYDQTSWAGANGALNQAGIDLTGTGGTAGVSYLTIDGRKRSGFLIQRWSECGIKQNDACVGHVIRNLEIVDCGWAIHNGGSTYSSNGVSVSANNWYADGFGVEFAGSNHLFSRLLIHDCGQDCFQTYWATTGFSNITVRHCWLYNGRTRPSGDIWNFVSHNDGIQVAAGNTSPTTNSGLTVDSCVIGPGFSSGMILSDPTNSTRTNTVAVSNTLFYAAGSNVGPQLQSGTCIHDGDGPEPTGWTIDRCTFDRGSFDNAVVEFNYATVTSSNLQITNSVWSGGNTMLVTSGTGGGGNYRYNCPGGLTGLATDLGASNPYVTSGSVGSASTTTDFTISGSSAASGKGSGITSSTQLLALIDTLNS